METCPPSVPTSLPTVPRKEPWTRNWEFWFITCLCHWMSLGRAANLSGPWLLHLWNSNRPSASHSIYDIINLYNLILSWTFYPVLMWPSGLWVSLRRFSWWHQLSCAAVTNIPLLGDTILISHLTLQGSFRSRQWGWGWVWEFCFLKSLWYPNW